MAQKPRSPCLQRPQAWSTSTMSNGGAHRRTVETQPRLHGRGAPPPRVLCVLTPARPALQDVGGSGSRLPSVDDSTVANQCAGFDRPPSLRSTDVHWWHEFERGATFFRGLGGGASRGDRPGEGGDLTGVLGGRCAGRAAASITRASRAENKRSSSPLLPSSAQHALTASSYIQILFGAAQRAQPCSCKFQASSLALPRSPSRLRLRAPEMVSTTSLKRRGCQKQAAAQAASMGGLPCPATARRRRSDVVFHSCPLPSPADFCLPPCLHISGHLPRARAAASFEVNTRVQRRC